MDEQVILNYSKELTLSFLEEIGAEIEDSHGLYTITFPTKYESLFGGITKRITFDHSVADVHSCEWVVPGSNFLAIVLGEIKSQAPVTGGHLKKQTESPEDCLENITTKNCHIIFNGFADDVKIAIRFYFNISVKSIKSISMLRWVDIDLETMSTLDFPSDIKLDEQLGTIKYEKRDPKIDYAYSKATEYMEMEMAPLAMKYVSKTQDSLEQDINSLNQVHTKRLKEINEDVQYQKTKLKEFDRKILRARQASTQQKYIAEKKKQSGRIKLAEDKAIKQIERLTADKELQIQQIEKRHRPVIDFSLIAGTAYSYNISKCDITLKNQHAEKNIKAEFLEPSQEFTIICEVCDQVTEKNHLCVNSHVTCDLCIRSCMKCGREACIQCREELNACYICKQGLCSDCSDKCNFCNEITCEKHLMKCPHCSETACFFCHDNCQYCQEKFCTESIISCNACKNRTCSNDAAKCMVCNEGFCPNDRQICAICEGIHCRNDSEKCEFCEQRYSSNCMSGKKCQTCSNFTEAKREDQIVQKAILVNSDLKKYKKWEYSENSQFCIYKAKKMFGSKTVILDKKQNKIIVERKGGWR